jgi:hypothetical protein
MSLNTEHPERSSENGGMSMSCEEIFFKQLREQGFRLTPQREMVLSVLHEI